MSGRRTPDQILRRPVVSEKSYASMANGKYVFRCFQYATKIEIARAVSLLFGVKVADVRVSNRKGKWKRMGRFIGRRKDWKKAYVRLEPDQKIEFFEGV